MKALTSFIAIGILFVTQSMAQAPQGFNYQAVIRDSNDILVVDQTIQLKFKIRSGSTSGPIKFTESHILITNVYGMVSTVIGQGSNQSGQFSNLDWSGDEFYLQVEIDLSGGSNYTSMGHTQFMSVPYALSAGDGIIRWQQSGNDINNNNNGNVLIDANRYLGIGTTSPIADFDIEPSGGFLTDEETGGINLRDASTGVNHWRIYNSNFFIRFNLSQNDGATYTPMAFVNSLDGSWNTVSDVSLKENIESMKKVLPSVMRLEPKLYHFDFNKVGSRKSLGFIAQDVQKLFPQVVAHEEGETLLGMDYSKFGVIAIKAIQEQQLIIEKQQAEIDALKKRLDALEK